MCAISILSSERNYIVRKWSNRVFRSFLYVNETQHPCSALVLLTSECSRKSFDKKKTRELDINFWGNTRAQQSTSFYAFSFFIPFVLASSELSVVSYQDYYPNFKVLFCICNFNLPTTFGWLIEGDKCNPELINVLLSNS